MDVYLHSKQTRKFHEEQLQSKPSVMDIITNKFKIPFRNYKIPPRYSEPNNKSAIQHEEFVRLQIATLLKEGKIKEVPDQPYCMNPLSVAVKTTGDKEKLRLVLDVSRHVNNYIDVPSTKLDDLDVIEKSLDSGSYMMSFDLKSQYHQVEIHDQYTQFLGFQFKNEHGEVKYYEFLVLPFGLNFAVFLVTDLFKPFKIYLNKLGITNFIYIDDGIILNKSKLLLEKQFELALLVLKLSGWQINVQKTSVNASHVLKHLGVIIDTKQFMFFAPDCKLQHLQVEIEKNSSAVFVTARDMAKVLGLINSLRKSHGNICNIMSRRCQHILGKYVNEFGWNTKVKLDEHALQELNFFRDNLFQYNGKFISANLSPIKIITFEQKTAEFSIPNNLIDKISHVFTSDASASAAFIYENDSLKLAQDYVFNEFEKSTSSSHRELLSIKKFFEQETHFLLQCKPGYIVWITDSSNLVLFLKKGSKNPAIQEDIFKIKMFEHKYQVRIYPVRISRNERIIQLADEGSRFSTSTDEWSVDNFSFNKICEYFQVEPSVDCFASRGNSKCSNFFSKVPQTDSNGVNFFAQTLITSEIFWICPPVKLIIHVLKHLSTCPNITGILIVPLWRSADFFTHIFQGPNLHQIITEVYVIKAKFICSNDATKNIFGSDSNFKTLACFIDTSNVHKKKAPRVFCDQEFL